MWDVSRPSGLGLCNYALISSQMPISQVLPEELCSSRSVLELALQVTIIVPGI